MHVLASSRQIIDVTDKKNALNIGAQILYLVSIIFNVATGVVAA
jgi:hypothetical protein